MYDPDENDYESIQNQWNPEDPSIILEERLSVYDEDEVNEEDKESDREYDDNMPPYQSINHGKSAKLKPNVTHF